MEIGNDYGAMGMLYVQEEYRGHGLGKVITSQLAQKYINDGLPAYAFMFKANEISIRMHAKCGFTEIADFDFILYHPKDSAKFAAGIGFLHR
ncbi:glycine n-acyltransferase [Plakobranchus ocellatus]|uniref:Glycine N-acyltransferase-like protein n=1 Tax=Plakobranchus ocellatus TaxID=259542 RepID=A0AAV3YJ56_9GAST|nr:glycine n-acyltransferase [Plakobranchus ocellatus]